MNMKNWAISSSMSMIPWGIVLKPLGESIQGIGLGVQIAGMVWLINVFIDAIVKGRKS